MPEISRFFGIIIAMFYDEHNPPHFHPRYGDDKAAMRLKRCEYLRDTLRPVCLGS